MKEKTTDEIIDLINETTKHFTEKGDVNITIKAKETFTLDDLKQRLIKYLMNKCFYTETDIKLIDILFRK